MATPAAALAVVRAARPAFGSPADKLTFFVHAVLSVNGLRLLAVGDIADAPDDAVLSSTEEAPLDGWNSSSAAAGGSSAGADASTGDPTAPPQCYTFLYAIDSPAGGTGGSTAGTGAGAGQGPRRLLVKALPVEGSLMVNLMADPLLEGAAPSTLELQMGRFTGDGPETGYAYAHAEELVGLVQSALAAQVGSPKPGPAQAGGATSAATTSGVASNSGNNGGSSQQGSDRPAQPRHDPDTDFDPLRDYSQPSRAPGSGPGFPGRNPLLVGDEDVLPGFLPRPGMGGMGGMGPFPGGGGGMHMGPGHPAFAGRARQPPGGFAGPGGLRGGPPGMPPGPGGMRWDPINPEGLQGWNPDDFQRPGPGGRGRGIDPDVMQPGPGRGPDWDAMFG